MDNHRLPNFGVKRIAEDGNARKYCEKTNVENKERDSEAVRNPSRVVRQVMEEN